MKSTTLTTILPLTLLALLWAGACAAREVPRTMTVADRQLVLNGYGERELMWMDVYRCALYLSEPIGDRARIIREQTPKLLVVELLIDEVPVEMPQRWRKTLLDELTGETFKRMKTAYRQAQKNDRLMFAYVPEQGTTVSMNDEVIFVDPGFGLMRALLEQWLGENAVSRNLRRLLSSPGASD